MLLADLSIVIPLAPGETEWKVLLEDLKLWVQGAEIIVVSPETLREVPLGINVVQSTPGRATQLNHGARHATRPFIWFLHADTRLGPNVGKALLACEGKRALYYFDLRFHDGSTLMRVNECGVLFRSRVFKIPFGDQGFLVSRELFKELGGFDERAVYGEDHLFVWRARQKKVAIQSIGASLSTSARQYRQQGWFRTTVRFGYLTWKQALPQIWALLKSRVLVS